MSKAFVPANPVGINIDRNTLPKKCPTCSRWLTKTNLTSHRCNTVDLEKIMYRHRKGYRVRK